MRVLKVATFNLNQWAMDFDSNLKNIKDSIAKAKQAGAVIRLGPELEITGYGCEDHFFEIDTVSHSWECLKELLTGDWTDGILCSFGMPVMNGSDLYNCQVVCMNRKIIMIRPKTWLANDGNYREFRWFKAWKKQDQLVELHLPYEISEALHQKTVPFGYGYIQFMDTAVAAEVSDELFAPNPPNLELALNGVEVFMNAGGSHHQLRKNEVRVGAIMRATKNSHGGVYMYSNHKGCDGGRVYYDGCACVAVNGDLVAQGSQFSLKDAELVVAQIDLDVVSNIRKSSSSFQDEASRSVPSVKVPYSLCHSFDLEMGLSIPIKKSKHSTEEEIAYGPSCWLWDYLRRSRATGFLLPLSGGADSSSVAAMVGSMCQLVVKEIANGNEQVKADAIRIGNYKEGEFPIDSREFARRIFYTVFMGSENNSEATKSRAKVLANEIGSWHFDIRIDSLVSSFLSLFFAITGMRPRYKAFGGSKVENLALHNIQARIRMVLAFMLASLLPWVHGKPGFFLVLGSTNVDEKLRGNLTKYDCSSADINPIGGLNKVDLRSFLRWGAVNLGYSSLADIEAAPSTGELEPPLPKRSNNYNNIKGDEKDMGMTYEELSIYGKLRKTLGCGPVSMFKNLCNRWGATLTPLEVAEKVKHFFKYYAINRHKLTVLTPSYHAESYSPEDNRYDLRQLLYNEKWTYQFRKIDELVREVGGDYEKIQRRETSSCDGKLEAASINGRVTKIYKRESSCNFEKLGSNGGVGIKVLAGGVGFGSGDVGL
ncbi:hypothetical protein FEM48_Zijuj11G0008100 [Ziziphus jujuba var. spinosa]|uniref:Glutamine-dependent NAD(+) synthetase n=1 Tax=Ziziphus jujuba var. spinosa TaxID=714518 RepID=A0A978UFW1_ZIZJJ|nr:hypothetical protein FEM48_Zijuj11G0008100 [Ziziphus jujuba var. spinosa]